MIKTNIIGNAYHASVEIKGSDLTIEHIQGLIINKSKACISNGLDITDKINKSQQCLESLANKGAKIYGVTTNFGGMANSPIRQEELAQLQSNLIWGLKCGVGDQIDEQHVAAAMICRANSLMKGVSGIRLEIIERICILINNNIMPVVYEHGSIGASGDLVPLAHIAGALIGLSDDFAVNYKGQRMGAVQALNHANLGPVHLKAKEGLALVNGTSVSTGIAVNSLASFAKLFDLTLYLHSMFILALDGHIDAFHPFVHQSKPHPGQIAVANVMWNLLVKPGEDIAEKVIDNNRLAQDRYSIRCLPQFLGVIYETLEAVKKSLEIEINSANDNPLVDYTSESIFNTGNFLGEHVAVGMDQLRHGIALLAKHMDAQIALIMAPEFNHGLPPSLALENDSTVKFGLKGLQISMNSIMSMLTYYGNGYSHLFSTHCEQFNQNINSLSYGAANLTWKAVVMLKDYLAMASIAAVQAVELKSYQKNKKYDARQLLSPPQAVLYERIYAILNKKIDEGKPLISGNQEQSLSMFIRQISGELFNIFN